MIGLAGLAVIAWLPLAVVVREAIARGVRLPAVDFGFWAMLGRSLAVSLGTALLALALGAPLAYLLSRARLPYARLLRSCQVLPLLLPPYVGAIGWLHLLGRNGSWTRWLAALLGRERGPVNLYTPAGAAWVLGLWLFPLVTLILLPALDAVSPDLEEEAYLQGGAWTAFRHVTAPLAAPALLSALLMVFLLALGDFAVPSFFAVPVYTVETFARFSAFYDFASGTATALPLVLLATLAFLAQRSLGESLAAPPLEGETARRRLLPLGWWRWVIACLCLAVPLAAVLLPLGALATSGLAFADVAQVWDMARREMGNSLAFAAGAALLGVALALPLAWLAARASRGRALAEALALMPLAVPGIVLGIGMIRLWNRGIPFSWVYQTPLIVMLGQTARAVPLAVVALLSGLRQVPVVLEEVALVARASWWQTVRWLYLPLLRPALAAAFCLAFVAAITELPATLLVYPPGDATLPVRIYTLQHEGTAEHVAALCLIMTATSLFPALLAWRLYRPREDWR